MRKRLSVAAWFLAGGLNLGAACVGDSNVDAMKRLAEHQASLAACEATSKTCQEYVACAELADIKAKLDAGYTVVCYGDAGR